MALLAILGAIVLAGTGCGGGGGETTDLTRGQYIDQANKICGHGKLEREQLITGAQKLAKPGEKVSTATKEKVMISVIANPYQKMVGELKELELPEKGQKEFEELLASMEKSSQEVHKDPLKAITSIAQFKNSNELARKYGLENCAI
ncbi:MAG TPA: hypothetical protein VF009_02270 [Solirubrobacterales bacterium]